MTRFSNTGVNLPGYLEEREQAKQWDRLTCIVSVLAGIALIGLAARLQQPINQQREELQLVTHDNIKDVPPKYAWITAMSGSFRGLAINYLWYRAEELKQAGKYYESSQLADWITTMQPRFAAVWGNRAWDLSYNISVGTHTPEERWQWVYNGIRLLRDRGIPNNPRVLILYKELAWIFFHKVGEMSDDMHWYYKREWAALMENILGSPPRGASQEVIEYFRPVALAPDSLSKLLAENPELLPLIDALREAGVDVEATTRVENLRHPLEGTFFNRYGKYVSGTDVQLDRYRAGADELSESDKLFVAAVQAAPASAMQALLAYLRAKVLREQYRLDPAFMLQLMTSLVPGRPDLPVPLDWRLPETHSIYWSRYGVDTKGRVKTVTDSDVLNTDRNTLFALMVMCKRGRLTFEINRDAPNQSAYNLAPELRLVEPMHQMYIALGKRHAEKDENVGDTAGELLKSGHVNTLEEMITLYYIRGQVAEANRYFAYLRENYFEDNGQPKARYQTDIETFVTRQIREDAEVYTTAIAMINEFLNRAMFSLSDGDGEAYLKQVDYALMVHRLYSKQHKGEREGRLTMSPFEDIQANALINYLQKMQSILARVTVWQAIENRIKQKVYDLPGLLDYLREECDVRGLDVAKAFPEPAGMGEYRMAKPEKAGPEMEYREKLDINTPAPEK